MSKYVIMLAAIIAATTLHAEQQAPQTRDEVEQVFQSLDRDEDDRISKSEAQRRAELRERFGGVDSSGDGYLSRNEYLSRPSDERFE
jgi:Ca2+-binding EF-hand superfamily protein